MNNKNNKFYDQVKKNLHLKSNVDKTTGLTLLKTHPSWFNTVYSHPTFIKRQNNDVKKIKTNFDKSKLDKNFIRDSKIAKVIGSCLLSGYQELRSFYGNYENFIEEYKYTKTPNRDFAETMRCVASFLDLFNHGFITGFEPEHCNVDIGKFIEAFEKNFQKLNDEQKKTARKYVNEILCAILMFNMLDRKSGNVLIDKNKKINFIDFDNLLLNKGELFKEDTTTTSFFSDLGKFCNTESIVKSVDKDSNIQYTDYHKLLNKYEFQIGNEMMSTIDKMLEIDENMIRAMFVDINAVVPDCSFEEAKQHISKELDRLIKYRQNLFNSLSLDCTNIKGRCYGAHNCIIAPKKVVNEEIVEDLRKKLHENIEQVEKCKKFLNNYKEQDFKDDFTEAVNFYKSHKENNKKDINFSVSEKLSKCIETNQYI